MPLRSEHQPNRFPNRIQRDASTVPAPGSASVSTNGLISVRDLAAHRHAEVTRLAANLKMSPCEGRIWLADERMTLIHLKALSTLRRELIESVGLEKARGLLTRMGYSAGTLDAEVARKLRPDANFVDHYFIGPNLAAIEGMCWVEVIRLEMDPERGYFDGEFIWRDSSEAEEHIAAYGISQEPVCWWTVGYASGYSVAFMGRPIVYRETQCSGMGDPFCHVIGRPADDLDDADHALRALRSEGFVNRPLKAIPIPESIPSSDADPRPAQPAAARIRAARTIAPLTSSDELVGISVGFNTACHRLRKVADSYATVLFLGETGVGKEMFARTLHRISSRSSGPLITVNCAAIPETLLESELFGVERGAFTGATESRAGRFERADGGTLFLDEVASLTPSAQGKLLRALQEREIERVGDTRTRRVDVRVAAAANVDLEAEVRAGRFRADLFYRLNVFPIRIPPLRERREDIPLLMNHLLHKFRALNRDKEITGFTEQAISLLLDYDYPGNIRELENIIERAVIMAGDGGPIGVEHLSLSGSALRASGQPGSSTAASPMTSNDRAYSAPIRTADVVAAAVLDRHARLDDLSASVAHAAMSRARGNLSAAARMLGITRPQLAYRLKHSWRNNGSDSQ